MVLTKAFSVVTGMPVSFFRPEAMPAPMRTTSRTVPPMRIHFFLDFGRAAEDGAEWAWFIGLRVRNREIQGRQSPPPRQAATPFAKKKVEGPTTAPPQHNN
jgi:hypothetical protein